MVVRHRGAGWLACGLLGAAALGSLAAPLRAQGRPAPASPDSHAHGDLRGVVRDSAGAPLAAARVRLLELHREYLTHEDGSFVFADVPAGRYAVGVLRIGYRSQTATVTVTSGGSARLEIALGASPVQLSAFVTTGTVVARSRDDVLSPTSVLSEAALDRRLDGTVAQTLQGQPGVSITSMGPATARPVIRGLSGDRILVLEDGQRPGDLSSTSADHGVAIDPLTARQIEVVRGPMSLLYGSSALGGVVNVVREEVPSSLPEHGHGSATVQGSPAKRG